MERLCEIICMAGLVSLALAVVVPGFIVITIIAIIISMIGLLLDK